jgi:predicted metal-dependent hydrolase
MMIELNGDAFRVEVVRSATRRSSVSLKYAEHGNFVLSVPVATSENYIHEFLERKRGWMQKIRGKARERDRAQTILPGSRMVTEFYSLIAAEDSRLVFPQYRVERRKAEQCSVFHLAPGFFAVENQAKLWQNLEKYLLAQLVKLGSQSLIERTHYLAGQHKISVREVFVRVQKSRLGYCTHDDRIMLNARLLFAPQKIRDYVIHHELAHTRHRNHSKQYWAYLEQLFSGAKTIDKMLRDSSVYSMKVEPPGGIDESTARH